MQEHLSNRFPKESSPESSQSSDYFSLQTLLGYKTTAIDHMLTYNRSLLEFFYARDSVRGRNEYSKKNDVRNEELRA